MLLYIDQRAGSEKLIDKFPGECESTILEAGDVAFFGNGPKNESWYIGIEYKTVNDVAGCVKSGRFAGTQLPAMLALYDVCFLLVEGIYRKDIHTGNVVRYQGKNNSFSLGLQYQAFDNFLTSVSVFSTLAGKPCIVKCSSNIMETVTIIRDIHAFFAKDWDDHTAMRQPDKTKIQNVSYDFSLCKEPEPGEAEYPRHLLRKALFQIRGVGWELAGHLADAFGTMESALKATQKDWGAVDRVGAVLAARTYEALHGYPDPTILPKKVRRKIASE